MPIYEYYCVDCRSRFEALRPMSQSDSPITCPGCETDHTRRVISRVAAISRENGGSRLVSSSVGGGGCGSCAGGHCATCGH